MSNADFNKANETVHPVETQWHYPILTKFGFVPEEKTGVGFVRSYSYVHQSGAKIKCTTGASSDYWTDITAASPGANGYWSKLEPHLVSLNLDKPD